MHILPLNFIHSGLSNSYKYFSLVSKYENWWKRRERAQSPQATAVNNELRNKRINTQGQGNEDSVQLRPHCLDREHNLRSIIIEKHI